MCFFIYENEQCTMPIVNTAVPVMGSTENTTPTANNTKQGSALYMHGKHTKRV